MIINSSTDKQRSHTLYDVHVVYSSCHKSQQHCVLLKKQQK